MVMMISNNAAHVWRNNIVSEFVNGEHVVGSPYDVNPNFSTWNTLQILNLRLEHINFILGLL